MNRRTLGIEFTEELFKLDYLNEERNSHHDPVYEPQSPTDGAFRPTRGNHPLALANPKYEGFHYQPKAHPKF